jgi:hypothetical protein
MLRSFFKLISYFFMASCHKILKPPVPDTKWDLFDSPAAGSLPAYAREGLEGVYAIEASEDFGKLAAIKWSTLFNGADTTYYLSFFCEEDAAYFICEGRQLNDSILLNGYWRKAMNSETGKVRFIISQVNGAGHLLDSNVKPYI